MLLNTSFALTFFGGCATATADHRDAKHKDQRQRGAGMLAGKGFGILGTQDMTLS